MPNANKPSGLSPVGYLSGADWDGRGNIYYIASTDTNPFFVGDPVVLSGDGHATLGIPGVTIGVAGSAIVGVILAIGSNADGGPYIDPANLSLVSAPATKTKAYYALVADDPNTIFEIQEGTTAGAAGTALTSAAIGLNANFVAVSPATGVNVSGYLVDNATEATTATLNLKLLGLVRRADNAFGSWAKWRVLINNHLYRAGIAGV